MALILNGTTGITVTDGSNILQDGTVTTDDLANAAVTSAKMATGAAATNLGNYVQSFNGSTGAVTGVASFNGSTGAVTGVSTVNGSTGAVTVQPTLVSGSNIKTINSTSLLGSGDITVGASTTYGDIGTYFIGGETTSFSANSVTSAGATVAGSVLREPRNNNSDNFTTNIGLRDESNNRYIAPYNNGITVNAGLSGTWRRMGIIQSRSGSTIGGLEANFVSLFVRVS